MSHDTFVVRVSVGNEMIILYVVYYNDNVYVIHTEVFIYIHTHVYT